MTPEENVPKQVLLVDDEEHTLATARLWLQGSGITDVLTSSDSRQVIPLLDSQAISVVVLDLHMPHLSGRELLPKLVRDYPQVPVILMTADDDIDTVVDCMRTGAFDYLVKPAEPGRLVSRVRKALEMCSLSREISSLKTRLLNDELERPEAFAAIVTGSKKMRAVFQYAEVVAGIHQPILITGETGTGKELMARALHELSGCQGAFVPVNVAGLDDNMFTDTLFGHKRGAFTGADQAREGLIVRASGGTLFLDEIGDLNEASQIKLLRLLQEQEFYPVGSDVIRKSNARLVMATNRDLQKSIAAGSFRKDLYYRLFAHRIHIPALRDRPEDIPLLLDHFLALAAERIGKKKPTPPPELATLLALYPFPGNVREIEALVFDAVARHSAGVLSMESFREVIGDERLPLPAASQAADAAENPLGALFGHFPTIGEVEEYLIGEALKMAKGNQGMAAKLLGIGRQTLNKRLKKGDG